jgi:hypothetical protein
MTLSPCGIDCELCPFYQKDCDGCKAVEGKPFWTEDAFPEGCPLYECSITKHKFTSCGCCDQLPCKIYFDLKDPNLSDETHQEMIVKRVELLKNNS